MTACAPRCTGWRAAVATLVVLLAGCAGTPPPDWAVEAKSALERAVEADFAGRGALAELEYDRARRALARTGRVDLLARAELTRCAARVASLVFEPCAGFEALRADAPPAERAYADFLAGRLVPAQIEQLPPQHRAVAAATAPVPLPEGEPLSQLAAAGVLLQAGHADARTVAQAVDVASAQGWRRPLLAWLGVQQRVAEQAGRAEEAQRAQRRIELIVGQGTGAPR